MSEHATFKALGATLVACSVLPLHGQNRPAVLQDSAVYMAFLEHTCGVSEECPALRYSAPTPPSTHLLRFAEQLAAADSRLDSPWVAQEARIPWSSRGIGDLLFRTAENTAGGGLTSLHYRRGRLLRLPMQDGAPKLALSSIRYSPDGSVAVLYVDYQSMRHEMQRDYVVLRRGERGGWRVIRTILVQAS